MMCLCVCMHMCVCAHMHACAYACVHFCICHMHVSVHKHISFGLLSVLFFIYVLIALLHKILFCAFCVTVMFINLVCKQCFIFAVFLLCQ